MAEHFILPSLYRNNSFLFICCPYSGSKLGCFSFVLTQAPKHYRILIFEAFSLLTSCHTTHSIGIWPSYHPPIKARPLTSPTDYIVSAPRCDDSINDIQQLRNIGHTLNRFEKLLLELSTTYYPVTVQNLHVPHHRSSKPEHCRLLWRPVVGGLDRAIL